MDYDDGLPQESVVLYYHTSDEEKRRMFPADPNIRRTVITSSVTTSQRARFRDDILERDERQCTLSNIEETYCEAVHLVAHSKGDVVCYLSFTRAHSCTITTAAVHIKLHSAS
jgi:5-methylcytosine-specific restriction endonuclease McrA